MPGCKFYSKVINQKSLKVINQRSTRSEDYKRHGGWERDGGNVDIIRHEGTSGSSWKIPLLAEAAVVLGESLLWVLDLE